MARYAPLTLDTAAALPASRPATKSVPPKAGILHRIVDALVEARTRQAEREIQRYLTTRSVFTDEVEREIERRLVDHPAAAAGGR